jgi:hypothetical protein
MSYNTFTQPDYGIYSTRLRHLFNQITAFTQLDYGIYSTRLRHLFNQITAFIQPDYGLIMATQPDYGLFTVIRRTDLYYFGHF